MPKSAKNNRTPKKKSNRPARTANRALWEFYQLGKRIKTTSPSSATSGPKLRVQRSLREFCEEEGVAKNTAEKARSFVSRFTEKDLQWLCNLGISSGKPLKTSHIHRLLVLPTKAERKKYAKRASMHCWSVRQLSCEIAKTVPKRSQGGARPSRPETVEDVLLAIESMTGRWLRYYEVLEEASDECDDGVSVKDLTPTMRKWLKKTTHDIKWLHETADKQMKRKLRLKS